MRNIFTQIIKIAPTDSTILISGESGTGKELIASSIYEHSLLIKKVDGKVEIMLILHYVKEGDGIK
jgi:DNA-binding NtrC family response regulator